MSQCSVLLCFAEFCIDCGAKWPLAKEQKEKKREMGGATKKEGKFKLD